MINYNGLKGPTFAQVHGAAVRSVCHRLWVTAVATFGTSTISAPVSDLATAPASHPIRKLRLGTGSATEIAASHQLPVVRWEPPQA